MEMMLKRIGTAHRDGEDFWVELEPEYRPGLEGLEGFSYVDIIWWFHRCDNQGDRALLTEEKPYVQGPDRLGVFATRSPRRPNPLALSCAYVTYVDRERGAIGLAYLDADDGSPVLDLKPYTPSLDRVAAPGVPRWCAQWPQDVEHSGDFDWSDVFNF